MKLVPRDTAVLMKEADIPEALDPKKCRVIIWDNNNEFIRGNKVCSDEHLNTVVYEGYFQLAQMLRRLATSSTASVLTVSTGTVTSPRDTTRYRTVWSKS